MMIVWRIMIDGGGEGGVESMTMRCSIVYEVMRPTRKEKKRRR
jgi:hypothetical protein